LLTRRRRAAALAGLALLPVAPAAFGQALERPAAQAGASPDAISVPHGAQNLTVAPEGNPARTLASFNGQARAASATSREFMVNLGFTSAVGGNTPNADKVVVYAGMTCQPGSGNCWAMNPLATAAPGFKGGVQTLEADLNNFAGDAPPDGPLRTALAANGATGPGLYNTSGLFIGSVNGTPIFHAGVLGDNRAVLDALVLDHDGHGAYSYLNLSAHSAAAFADNGVSPAGLSLGGTYSLGAIVTAGARTGIGAIILGNTQAIVSQTAGNKGNVPLLSMDAGNVVHLASGAAAVALPGVIEARSAVPATSSSPCTPGQHAWDQAFEYRCVAPNAWKRAALADW